MNHANIPTRLHRFLRALFYMTTAFVALPTTASITINGLSDMIIGGVNEIYTQYYPRDAAPVIYDLEQNNSQSMFLSRAFTISRTHKFDWQITLKLPITLKLQPNLLNTGQKTYDGHTIFKRQNDNSNIGFIFDIGFGNAYADLTPITDNEITLEKTLDASSCFLLSCTYKDTLSLRIRPVIYAPLPVGSNITLPNNKIATATLLAMDNAGESNYQQFSVILNQFSLVNRPYTCLINESDKNKTVQLNTIAATDLIQQKKLAAGTFSIGLNCAVNTNGYTPLPITQIYAVMTDQNSPSNRSDILTLFTNGKENPSVGLQIIKPDRTPIKYGPNSANKGTENQWLFAENSRGLNNSRPQMTFSVNYVLRNKPVISGKVTGTATITFSYQ